MTAANRNGPKLLQLYMWRDRGLVRAALQQAKEAGFVAAALTADVPWHGNRERDRRNGFSVPPNYSLKQIVEAAKAPAWTWDFLSNPVYRYAVVAPEDAAESMAAMVQQQMNPAFSWADAEWLLGEWGGPMALKGVVSPRDAKRAAGMGFSCVWVSNHGGRQLETAPAPIDVLPEIRSAVGPEMQVVMDGGVTRGHHILKALALGADGVGLGRAYLYGLTAGGTAGVRKVMSLLRHELQVSMLLLGIGSIDELKARGGELVIRRTRRPN